MMDKNDLTIFVMKIYPCFSLWLTFLKVLIQQRVLWIFIHSNRSWASYFWYLFSIISPDIYGGRNAEYPGYAKRKDRVSMISAGIHRTGNKPGRLTSRRN